jgi:uncharacterized SAM-binding protein YcdF (DUF218 family)
VSFLLDPYPILVLRTAAGLAAVWRRNPAWRRGLLLVVAPFAGLVPVSTPAVAWLAAAALEWPYPPLEDRPTDCEAIVVLSGYARPPKYGQPEAELGEDTYRRCVQAAWLYRRGKPCLVVATGGKVKGEQSEAVLARVMGEFLQRQGVDAADLLLEERSPNTYENAAMTAQLLRDRGIRRIVLVTDAIHLWRAERCFVAQGHLA